MYFENDVYSIQPVGSLSTALCVLAAMLQAYPHVIMTHQIDLSLLERDSNVGSMQVGTVSITARVC
jgi:hypothetical protein